MENVCDRIAMLVSGRLGTLGSVKELLSIDHAVQMTIQNLPPEELGKLRASIQRSGGEIV